MKALVYHTPKNVQVDNVPDPKLIEKTDAIIRVTSTAICGSDLHIYNGMIPQLENMIVGHEFMGIVEETGVNVHNLKKGDRVVVPFPIACGHCYFCSHDMYPHCENSNDKYGPEGDLMSGKGAGLFGYTDLYGGYDGGQAEYVRVPYADVGPRKVDDALTDDQLLFLTDIFPTGYAAIDWANLQGGETVAVLGCGPVGLMAQKSAWLKGAKRVIGLDIQEYRMATARRRCNSETINASDDDAIEQLRAMTNGRGPDVVVDAVGMEADRNFWDKITNVVQLQKGSMSALSMAFEAVRRGGTVSIVGVYGSPYNNFPMHRIFDKGLTLKMGQAPVQKYIDELIDLVKNGKVVLEDIISHHLPLTEAPRGYEIFSKKQDNCVKVVLNP